MAATHHEVTVRLRLPRLRMALVPKLAGIARRLLLARLLPKSWAKPIAVRLSRWLVNGVRAEVEREILSSP